MKIRDITLSGLLLAVALTMYVIENQIPVPVPVPGFKLGLSNIITLITLYKWDAKHSLIILVLRICLSAAICGSGMTFLYSIAGGLTSFAAIYIFKKISREKMITAVSIGGAAFHHAGQILMASIILKSTSIFIYFPILLALGTVTGTFTGIVADLIMKKEGKI